MAIDRGLAHRSVDQAEHCLSVLHKEVAEAIALEIREVYPVRVKDPLQCTLVDRPLQV